MNAPDKIYINGFSAFATVPVKEGIEYIRKDALLEWAEHMNGIYPAGAFQMMIDKLNSL